MAPAFAIFGNVMPESSPTRPTDQTDPSPPENVTRLAPSPTGALHLGNVRTFLVNHAITVQQKWRVLLRIEDLDGPRLKPGADEQSIRLLESLGITWNDGPHFQSTDLSVYRDAMAQLRQKGKAYSSPLSRREAEETASAPHEASQDRSAGPIERPPIEAGPFDEPDENHRFVTDAGSVEFDDCFAGAQSVDVARTEGDFVIWRRADGGLPAYQLAVVVDDARQGVTQVVRGDDLIPSTGMQIQLYRSLDMTNRIPVYTHLPLVVGTDGKRLAKRHGDTRLQRYLDAGVRVERVIGLIAYWSGAARDRREMSTDEFVQAFRLDTMPHEPTVYTPEDDAWLIA
ncbi:MAG: glutamate--tRNA ligase family protein [Planctomycetota bacterium]